MQKIPTLLSRVLAKDAKAKAQWESLTPLARRDFVTWISSAKQEETRQKRAQSVPSRLASGKRRPCCYALVPMNLYKALGENPKAKATWATLSPGEKRDLAAFVHNAKDATERALNTAKVCGALARGQHHA